MINGLLVFEEQHVLADHVVQRLECEVRIHGRCPVANQQAVVVDFAGLSSLDDERGFGARAFPNQMMVHAGGRQQAWNRRDVLVDAAIRKNQDGRSVFARPIDVGAKLVHRFTEPGPALADSVGHRNRGRLEARKLDVAQLGQIVVVHHRRLYLDHPAAFALGFQEVALGPECRRHRGNELFPNRIERWIRHLCKELLEVAEQGWRPVRQHRKRGICSH